MMAESFVRCEGEGRGRGVHFTSLASGEGLAKHCFVFESHEIGFRWGSIRLLRVDATAVLVFDHSLLVVR